MIGKIYISQAIRAALMTGTCAWSFGHAHAGSISYSREIRVPTEYKATTIRTPGGGAAVVVTPSQFETRKIGDSVNIRDLGVVQKITLAPGNREIVDLRMPDGTLARTWAGQRMPYRGRTLLVIGWRGDQYLVQDTVSQRTVAWRRSAP